MDFMCGGVDLLRVGYREVALVLLGSGNRAQQLPHKAVQFVILDQSRRSLSAQRTTEETRQSKHRLAAACQAMWSRIGANQFALGAKDGSWKREEVHLAGRDSGGHRTRFLRAVKENP
jgi:hypothetical protein